MFIRYILQVSCYFLGVPRGSNLHVLSAHVLYLFTTKVHALPVSSIRNVYITWWVYITLNTRVTSSTIVCPGFFETDLNSTTTASKYTPKRPRICINWNPPFQTLLITISIKIECSIATISKVFCATFQLWGFFSIKTKVTILTSCNM